MPTVLAEIGYEIWVDVAIAAEAVGATTAVAFAMGSIAEYAAGAFLLNAATKALSPKTADGSGRGLDVQIADSAQDGFIIYGQVRVAGVHVIPGITGGASGNYLEQVIALAIHPCTSIDQIFVIPGFVSASTSQLGAISGGPSDGVYINGGTGDNAVWDNHMWIRLYPQGNASVDWILNNRYPASFDSNFKNTNQCYACLSYDWAGGKLWPSAPAPTFMVKGKALYDPRLDPAHDGTGYGNPSYTAFSSNPALAWADLAMADYGGNLPASRIDWPMLIAAANICDVDNLALKSGSIYSPPGFASPALRYTINGRLSATRDWRENAKLICDCMLGFMTDRDGKWRVRAGSYDSPTYSIDKTDWLGFDSIQTISSQQEGRYNRVHVFYTDYLRNYQRVECYPRENPTYKNDDAGNWIDLQVEQPLCIWEYEAQRKGEFLLRQSRNQIKLVGRLPPRFLKLYTGMTVTLNFDDFGWSSKIFRILSMNLNLDGSVAVSLAEEQASDWNDLLTAEYNATSVSTVPATNPTVPTPPQALSIEPVVGGLKFSWLESIVLPKDTVYALRESPTTKYADSFEIWRGDATSAAISYGDTALRYFWVEAVSATDGSVYAYPDVSAAGIAAAPLPLPKGTNLLNVDSWYAVDSPAGNVGNFVPYQDVIGENRIYLGAGPYTSVVGAGVSELLWEGHCSFTPLGGGGGGGRPPAIITRTPAEQIILLDTPLPFVIRGSAGAGRKFKWNPGHYIIRDLSQLNTDRSNNLAATFAYMDTWAAHQGVKGFQIVLFWGAMENANVPGDYTGGTSGDYWGFRLLDAILARCASYPRPMHVTIALNTYGGGGNPGSQPYTFPSWIMPAYMNNGAYVTTGAAQNSTTGVIGGAWVNSNPASGKYVVAYPRYWDPAVMARLIALVRAYGQRYDGNTLIEMVSFLGETATNSTDFPTDEAISLMIGAGGLHQAIAAAWPTTLRRWWANFANYSVTNFRAIIDSALANYFCIGGPDCYNETGAGNPAKIDANLYFRGHDASDNAISGARDWRGVSEYIGEVEQDEYVMRNGTFPPAQYGSGVFASSPLTQINLYKGSHLFWTQNTGGYPGGDASMQMDTSHPNLLDFIDKSAGFTTANNGTLDSTTAPAIANLAYPSGFPTG